MWHFISEHISQATGQLFICEHARVAQGGDSHACYIIHDHQHRFFVKTRPYDDTQQLSHEAEGLTELGGTQCVLTPSVICHGVTRDESPEMEYLVLSYVKFITPSQDAYQRLGEQLANLHLYNGYSSYGWPHDNYIGLSIQRNGRKSDWAAFFAECRIGSMLERLAEQGHYIVSIDNFVDDTKQYFSHHQPHLSLLHGDLWHGNVGFCHRGPVVFDPAIYVGDSESDLAMAELFGGFPADFFHAYAEVKPISRHYAERKLFYQLYHILNHGLLFGGHYLAQAKDIINTIRS